MPKASALTLLHGDPAELANRLRSDSNGLLDELLAAEANPIVDYLAHATPETLDDLAELAERDRRYGIKPTPQA
ncbi:MAG TPA: hypothetical protein VGI10_12575 [Polyangiaceae bacterium]|jgi:hypothetical protein